MRGALHLAALLLILCACTPPAANAPSAADAAQQRDVAAELAEINACGYLGCRGPFHVASELDIGFIAMGTTLSDIPRGATCSNTLFQSGPARLCVFTMEGVIYTVIDGVVTGKTMNVTLETASGLPFGLSTDQTLEEALATMREHTQAPLSIKTFPGGARYISNDDILKNGHDRPFLFTLLFVNDRLAQILLQDPSAPSD